MRNLLAILAAAGMMLLGVSAASAGPLTSATLSLNVRGVSVNVTAPSTTPTRPAPGGGYTTNAIHIDAGSAFATTRTVTLTTNPTLTKLKFVIGANGGFTATRSGAVNFTQHTASGAPVGIQGYVDHYGLGGLDLFRINLNIGGSESVAGSSGGGYWLITVIGNPWTLGQTVQSNLTLSGSPLPNQTLTGSFGIQPSGAGGSVKLVATSRVLVTGATTQTTAVSGALTLVPEPGTLLLLGAGIAGLVALGRKKRA